MVIKTRKEVNAIRRWLTSALEGREALKPILKGVSIQRDSRGYFFLVDLIKKPPSSLVFKELKDFVDVRIKTKIIPQIKTIKKTSQVAPICKIKK